MKRARSVLVLRGLARSSLRGAGIRYRTSVAAAEAALEAGPDRVLPAPDYRTWLPDGAVKLRMQVCCYFKNGIVKHSQKALITNFYSQTLQIIVFNCLDDSMNLKILR